MYQFRIIINWIKPNENRYTAIHTEIEVWSIIFTCKTSICNDKLLMIAAIRFIEIKDILKAFDDFKNKQQKCMK